MKTRLYVDGAQFKGYWQLVSTGQPRVWILNESNGDGMGYHYLAHVSVSMVREPRANYCPGEIRVETIRKEKSA